MSEKRGYDIFGTFRHASYNVQKLEPLLIPIEDDDDAAANVTTPLMGGPPKQDMGNLNNPSYPLTQGKTTGGKSRGSYNLLKQKNSFMEEKEHESKCPKILLFLLILFLVLFGIFLAVWAALFLIGTCKEGECNDTVISGNETNEQLFASGLLPPLLPITNYTESPIEETSSFETTMTAEEAETTTGFEQTDATSTIEQSETYSTTVEAVTSEDDILLNDTMTINCLSQFNDTDIAQFTAYCQEKGKSYSDDTETCNALSLFIASNKMIADLNKRYKEPYAQFAPTVFSDWDESRRDKMGVTNTAALNITLKQYFEPLTPSNKNVSYLEFSKNIVFDENSSMEWNIYTALQTVNNNMNSSNDFAKNNPPLLPNSTDVVLYEIHLDQKGDDRSYYDYWLLKNGPFVTNLLISNTFYNYKSGIFTADMCATDTTIVTFVLVLGNGESIDASGKKVNYWTVMPIGRAWKDWGEGGYMRIESEACKPPEYNDKLIVIN